MIDYYKKKFIHKEDAKKIKNISFILIISILVILLWFNLGHFHPNNVVNWMEDKVNSMGKGEGFPYDISGHRIKWNNFKINDGNIVFLSDSAFVGLNGSAKEICIKSHNFSNPEFRHQCGRYIIYDVGGNEYRIDTLSKTIHKNFSENKIICCDICETGEYAILSESKDYICQMAVYESPNKERYIYHFANKSVSDIAVGDGLKTVCTCGNYTKEGILNSFLYVHDIKREEPKHVFEFNDNMLFFIRYFSNGNVVAVGDRGIVVANSQTGDIKEISSDNKVITCFEFDKNEGIVYNIVSTNSGQNSEIVVVGIDGSISGRISCDNKFESISYKNGNIVGLGDGRIYLYDISGNVRNILETQGMYKSMKMCRCKKVCLMKENKIEIINLNQSRPV